MFPADTQTLRDLDLPEEDTRVLNKIIPDFLFNLQNELIQPHMAQKPVLRGEVGCACVAREVSVEREGMGERGCVQGAWVGGCGCEAD